MKEGWHCCLIRTSEDISSFNVWVVWYLLAIYMYCYKSLFFLSLYKSITIIRFIIVVHFFPCMSNLSFCHSSVFPGQFQVGRITFDMSLNVSYLDLVPHIKQLTELIGHELEVDVHQVNLDIPRLRTNFFWFLYVSGPQAFCFLKEKLIRTQGFFILLFFQVIF